MVLPTAWRCSVLTSEDSKWLERHRRALADHAERLGAPVPTVQGRFLSIIDKLQAELKETATKLKRELHDRKFFYHSDLKKVRTEREDRIQELEAKLAESEKQSAYWNKEYWGLFNRDGESIKILEERADKLESELKETQAKCAQMRRTSEAFIEAVDLLGLNLPEGEYKGLGNVRRRMRELRSALSLDAGRSND